MSNGTLKSTVRHEMQAKLTGVTAEQRRLASVAACDRLRSQEEWQSARAVLFYAARADELDMTPLMVEALAAGKRVALPRYREDVAVYEAAEIRDFAGDVAPGKFGIAEPPVNCPTFPLNRLDLVLVPGVCFDLTGRRLGRGHGYYDRLLGPVRGLRCGVGLDLQVRAEIPAEPHDVVLDRILTPTRWICLNRRAV